MTAGQVPIAATPTTVTSSKALAGSGSGITTGPTSSTSGDIVTHTGTAGEIQDSGVTLTAIPAADIAVGSLANGMTATTQTSTDNSTKLATTAFTQAAIAGVGGAGLTRISQQVLGSPAATITFSSIPGTYTNLLLYIMGQSSSGSDDFVVMQLNSDTGAHYNISGIAMSGASTSNAFTTMAGTSAFVVNLKTSSGASVHPGTGNCVIYNYAGTTFNKQWTCNDTENKSTFMNTEFASGEWTGTPAAVTTILLKLNSGSNFVTGTAVTLYGVQ